MITWLQDTTPGLLLLATASIAVLLLLIIKVKLEPFIALPPPRRHGAEPAGRRPVMGSEVDACRMAAQGDIAVMSVGSLWAGLWPS